MIICPKCKRELQGKLRYCPYCGEPLKMEPERKKKPKHEFKAEPIRKTEKTRESKDKTNLFFVGGLCIVVLLGILTALMIVFISKSNKSSKEPMTPSVTQASSAPTSAPTSTSASPTESPKQNANFVTEDKIVWGSSTNDVENQFGAPIDFLQSLSTGRKYNGTFTTDLGPYDGDEETVDWEFDEEKGLDTVSVQILPEYLRKDVVGMEEDELGKTGFSCTIPKVDDGYQRTGWIWGDSIITIKIPDDKTKNGMYSIRTFDGFIKLSPNYCADILESEAGYSNYKPEPSPELTSVPDTRTGINAEGSEGSYMIADSGFVYLSYNDLAGMSAWQLKVARNEIYARHGREFKDRDLRNYFSGQSWYYPSVSADAFQESTLNDVEKTNVKTIYNYEKQIGSTIADTVTP